MESEEMKQCPYCAETIRAEAAKCRYCGSAVKKNRFWNRFSFPSMYWRRVRRDKKIAGVCTGLAGQFGMPVLILPLRLLFVAATFLGGAGMIAYIVLWVLMPAPEKTDSCQPVKESAAVPNSAVTAETC